MINIVLAALTLVSVTAVRADPTVDRPQLRWSTPYRIFTSSSYKMGVQKCNELPAESSDAPDTVSWMPTIEDYLQARQDGIDLPNGWALGVDLNPRLRRLYSAPIRVIYPPNLFRAAHVHHGQLDGTFRCVSAPLRHCYQLDLRSAPQGTRCQIANGRFEVFRRLRTGIEIWRDLRTGYLWADLGVQQLPEDAERSCQAISSEEFAFGLPHFESPESGSDGLPGFLPSAEILVAIRNGLLEVLPPNGERTFLLNPHRHSGSSSKRALDLDHLPPVGEAPRNAEVNRSYAVRCFGSINLKMY